MALSCNITESQVPEPIKNAFKSTCPVEKDPNCRKDNNFNFDSYFKKEGEQYKADLTPNGSWGETESSIKKRDSHKVGQEAVGKEF
ncbi:hypothetical protein ACOCEA_06885 [Maribacter sp. CXY002]|uniref:hypothetical protein n=1 Tax=Maribacter luteocoastalis TaxID=3407671 RepID=UPI003B674903